MSDIEREARYAEAIGLVNNSESRRLAVARILEIVDREIAEAGCPACGASGLLCSRCEYVEATDGQPR